MKDWINFDAVLAVWKRQLWSLLGNPLGYVFVLGFVLVAAGVLFWPDLYFNRNITDMGDLLVYMPWLLVVLLPALTMGSWASERELGTEEQLLTLPMNASDALFGKWLGVCSFFTLALVCSLTIPYAIATLGSPDKGLIVSAYIGWWVAGLVFVALSLFASALVALPSVAFVLGALFCSGAMLIFMAIDWFDPFNRGLIPLGGVGIAAVMIGLALGGATMFLSSRRWQRQHKVVIVGQSVIFVCVVVTLLNLAVQSNRAAVDRDISSEGLSSLSPTSLKILRDIPQQVTITAFISKNPPPELALKAKEVENLLKVLEREVGDKIRLNLYRPADSLDDAGMLATQYFGLKPKKAVTDTVSGKDESEMFLGAVIACGARTQRIDYFDPGLSVEYELVRSIRTVANAKKKVLGIASTDLKMLGGFEQGMGRPQMRQDWMLVQEWKKQYEVREVNLDVAVGKDVDALVVPQPSRLGNKQLENLHNFIWEGRPALIMEDPLPAFSDPMLASSQPKQQQRNPMGGPPEPAEKGDLNPLLKSLGVRYEPDQIVWSEYNPSHEFRNALPRSIVWTLKEKSGILDSPVTTGVDSLLLLWPGKVTEAPDKNSELAVKALIKPIPSVNWGTHSFSEHLTMSPFGGMMVQTPQQYIPSKESAPALAVEITGKMKRAYPFPVEEKKEEKKDDKKDDKKEEPKKDVQKGLGDLSSNTIHVIFVADTDFASNQFFDFYRNENNKWSKDEFKFLQDLRNVQFLANAIDSLVGDEDLIALRTRRPIRRPHELLEEVQMKRQKSRNEAIAAAQQDANDKIKRLNEDFEKRLDRIEQNPEEDENVRAQMKEQVRKSAEGKLKADIDRINQKLEEQIRLAKIEEQREINRARWGVRAAAFGTPAAILLFLALTVFILRKRGERLIVPEFRKRSIA